MDALLLLLATSGILLGSVPEARSREIATLRAHFDTVNAELRGANVDDLTAGQRSARATLVGWLREYREAGRFPRNDRFPDRAMPFFRDSDGVLCAMAYLINRSGRGDLVDRIARTRNNAFIRELADDRALGTWLDSVGLTAAEAARIQPTYSPPPIGSYIAQYDSAWIQRDTARVGRFLAPQYEYSATGGSVRSRAATLAMLRARDYRLASARRLELKLPALSGFGDVEAVVSSRWIGEGAYRGKAFKHDYRCTQTWQPTARGWQIVSERCVPSAPATPP